MKTQAGQVIKSVDLVQPVSRFDLQSPGEDVSSPASEPAPVVNLTTSELESLQRRLRAEGYADALEECTSRAKREAAAEMEALLSIAVAKQSADMEQEHAEKLRALAVAMAEQLGSLRSALQAQVTEWAMVAVTRVLGQALATRVGVESIVHQVLIEAGLEGSIKVLVHKDDLAALEGSRERDPAKWPASIIFGVDPRIGLGGCLIESPIETIDASLEAQLSILRELLSRGRHK